MGRSRLAHEGYTTLADYKFGADYHWVCRQCFSELREIMQWTAS